MIRHLRWKVVATNMLLLSLVLLIMFAAVFFISRGNYRKNVQQQLNQALEQGDYGINQPGMDSIPCFVAEVYGSGTVRVAGNSYYDLSDETKMTEIVTAALRQDSDSGTLDEFHLRYLRRAGYTTTAIAFTDTYLEYTSLRTLLAACSMVGCGALVVLFVCSYLLSGVVAKPIGAAWMQQEQFLSDASHELKTPLTVILSSAELLERSATQEQSVYVDNIQAEGRRMKSLVEDMLTLARTESGAKQTLDAVNLSDTVLESALAFEPVAFENGKPMEYTVQPELTVSGRSAQLRQVADILLDNAVKYASPGSPITLRLEKDRRGVVIRSSNGCENVDADETKKLFDRFYRTDKVRSAGGFGIGLSIARGIAEAHKGSIKAELTDGNTIEFTAYLK